MAAQFYRTAYIPWIAATKRNPYQRPVQVAEVVRLLEAGIKNAPEVDLKTDRYRLAMTCTCCGEQRDPAELTALRCHPDVQVCRSCIGWLVEESATIDVTPTLPVLDMGTAVEFYETAGFEVRVYDGDGFAFVSYDGNSVFDLGLEPAAASAGAYLVVADPDGWHARLSARRLDVGEVADQDHGMREFSLTDPFGNRLRFGRSL